MGTRILERHGLTRAAAFRVINNAPLRTSAFPVSLAETLVTLGLWSFTFSSTNKNNE
jgi:hypothetical protein